MSMLERQAVNVMPIQNRNPSDRVSLSLQGTGRRETLETRLTCPQFSPGSKPGDTTKFLNVKDFALCVISTTLKMKSIFFSIAPIIIHLEMTFLRDCTIEPRILNKLPSTKLIIKLMNSSDNFTDT